MARHHLPRPAAPTLTGPVIALLLIGLFAGPVPAAAQDATISYNGRTYVLRSNDRACAEVRCPEGHTCFQGRCLALPPSARSCGEVGCAPGQVCWGGYCLAADQDYCARIDCPRGTTCISGACLAVSPNVFSRTQSCGPGEFLWRGQCLKSLEDFEVSALLCKAGELRLAGGCFNLQLKRDACAGVECPAGWPCVAGQCMKPREEIKFCEFCAPEDCIIGFCVLSGRRAGLEAKPDRSAP